MSKPTVLISGTGIASSILAFFLTCAGFHPIIVECSTSLRKAEQRIDIRRAALQTV
jgi:hypothetical protein